MMKQADIIRKIGNILTELQEQHQLFVEEPQSITELELELFLSNADFLTDHIHVLVKIAGQKELKSLAAPHEEIVPKETPRVEEQAPEPFLMPPAATTPTQIEVPAPAPEPVREEPVIVQFTPEVQPAAVPTPAPVRLPEPEPFIEPVSVIIPAPVAVAQPVKPADPVRIPEPVKEPVKEPEPMSMPAVPVKQPEPVAVAVPVKTAEVEEKPAKLTLNDLLGNNMTATHKTESAQPEIADLRQAISLNDKLLYIKDLFHGYGLAYAEVIDLLNKMPDFKSADTFLQKNYAVQNNWSTKQATVDRFYDLLKRRFPTRD